MCILHITFIICCHIYIYYTIYGCILFIFPLSCYIYSFHTLHNIYILYIYIHNSMISMVTMKYLYRRSTFSFRMVTMEYLSIMVTIPTYIPISGYYPVLEYLWSNGLDAILISLSIILWSMIYIDVYHHLLLV